MMLARLAGAVAAAVALGLAAPATAMPYYVGSPNGATCIPFGCSAADPQIDLYQQVFDKDATGYVKIGQMWALADGPLSPFLFGYTPLDPQYFYTAQPLGGLSTDPADNRGAALSKKYTLDGRPYWEYDPQYGNLLVELTSFSMAPPAAADYSGTVFSRMYRYVGQTQGVADSAGLFVRFGIVPEPSTWAMLLVGFFGLGGMLRRYAARLRPA